MKRNHQFCRAFTSSACCVWAAKEEALDHYIDSLTNQVEVGS